MRKLKEAKEALEEIVVVKWYDAYVNRDYIGNISDCDLAVNSNVGWILDENDSRVVIASGFSSTSEVDVVVIPTSLIIERFYPLKEFKVRNAELVIEETTNVKGHRKKRTN